MKNIIFATGNPGKLNEVRHLLKDLPVKIGSLIGRTDLPAIVEDQDTLEGNALKKARIISTATGMATLADDTGLEVYHLKMAPGVFSARYAGEDVSYHENNLKLLNELADLPDEMRGGQFRCVAAFIDGTTEKTFEGVCRGSILRELRGNGGFGYDPLFVPEGLDRTYAELPIGQKNIISHRAIAFKALKKFLVGYYHL